MAKVVWKNESDEHDYPAAGSYLSLVLDDPKTVERLVAALRTAEVTSYKAKDLLRAARLELLPVDNPHVAGDLRKIRKGRALSPVLIVRGDLYRGMELQIADGYHRVCASFHTDEDTDIPCRVVDLPRASVVKPAGRRPAVVAASGG